MHKKLSLKSPANNSNTIAYKSFCKNIVETKILLETGLSGLSAKLEEINKLLEYFSDIKGLPGRFPKDHKIQIKPITIDNESFVSMHIRTLMLLKTDLNDVKNLHHNVKFRLYSILALAIWSAFETYLIMLFEELFERKPEILISEEVVTYKEVISERNNILAFLIEKQLNKIGHFSHKEMCEYMNKKIKFNFSKEKQIKLSGFYLVRNIIAHNSGLVRNSLNTKLPEKINVKDSQIIITKAFLEEMIATIEGSVKTVERFILAKFFKKK